MNTWLSLHSEDSSNILPVFTYQGRSFHTLAYESAEMHRSERRFTFPSHGLPSYSNSSKVQTTLTNHFFIYFPYRCAKWILFINSPSKH